MAADSTALGKKRMPQATMLAKIEDVLKRGKWSDPPAYTLILGAGASFGVVPTAKEMLGIPDAKTRQIHANSIPLWLARQSDPPPNFADEEARLECSKGFWKAFKEQNRCDGIQTDKEGLPEAESIAEAYQAVFDTANVGGLDTPERHRNYMRAVMMSAKSESTQLNATHFYLASLLSLQTRSGQPGSDRRPFYTGKREFARTIFTTNFDPLLQTSLQLFQLLYYMTDRPEALAADALQTDGHPAIHLFYAHGSLHRPNLASAGEQIRQLKHNARNIEAYLGNHGVIVLGYSGWDDCLLEALKQATAFSNNLYWLARGEQSISKPVAEFLGSHSNAYWVEIVDGDNFMAELHARLCPGAPNTELLYNPIRPLLSQLECVSLKGIVRSVERGSPAGDKMASMAEPPRSVEEVRLQVIEILKDAERRFAAPSALTNGWQSLEREADLSYANNDFDKALDRYDALLKRSDLPVPRRALAFFRRGYCYGQKGEADRTIADYTAVIELPGAPVDQVAQARINRGVSYGIKDEIDKAIADAIAVIKLQGAPVDQIARARVLLGLSYELKGELDKALAEYTAVIELPGAPVEQVAKARASRALCYSKKKETDKAISDYTVVIELPDVPVDDVARAMFNRGFCYGGKEETDKAISDYTAVIELPGAPVDDVARARFNRGTCYSLKEETDKEIADYTAAIELPGAPVEVVAKARFYRGLCYEKKGELDKATADYSAVIELPGAPEEVVATAKDNLKSLKTNTKA